MSPDEVATGDYALRWSAHGTTDYGIPSKALEEALAAGRTIVLNVSRGAFAEAREKYSDRADVYVLLVTASREALRERLTARARDGDDAEAAKARHGLRSTRRTPRRGRARAKRQEPGRRCRSLRVRPGTANGVLRAGLASWLFGFGQVHALRRAPRGGRRRGRRLLQAPMRARVLTSRRIFGGQQASLTLSRSAATLT